jgi:hypothetical protein
MFFFSEALRTGQHLIILSVQHKKGKTFLNALKHLLFQYFTGLTQGFLSYSLNVLGLGIKFT